MMLNEMPHKVLMSVFIVLLLPTTRAQVLSMGSNVQNTHPLGGALIVGGSLHLSHGGSQKVQFSSSSQIGQPQPAHINQPQQPTQTGLPQPSQVVQPQPTKLSKPHHAQIGQPQQRQTGHFQPVHIDHPQPAHTGQSQSVQLSQLQHTRTGQHQPMQIDQPQQAQNDMRQPGQIGLPQPVQIDPPQSVYTDRPQPLQIDNPTSTQNGHPQPVQISQPQPLEMGQTQPIQINQPQPIQKDKPLPAQTGQSQPTQIVQPEPLQLGLRQSEQIGRPLPVQIGPSQPTHISQPELLFRPFDISNTQPIFQFRNLEHQTSKTISKPFVSSNKEQRKSTSVSKLMILKPTQISLNTQRQKSNTNNNEPKKNETSVFKSDNQSSLSISEMMRSRKRLSWIDNQSFSAKPVESSVNLRPNNVWNSLIQIQQSGKELGNVPVANKQMDQPGYNTMSSNGKTYEITTGTYISPTLSSKSIVKQQQTNPSPPWSQPQLRQTSPSPVTTGSQKPIKNTINALHKSKPSSAWTEFVPSRFQTAVAQGNVKHSASVVPQQRHQRHLIWASKPNAASLNTALTTTSLPWAQPRKPSILSSNFRQAPVFSNINELFQSNPSILSFGNKLPEGVPPLPNSGNKVSKTNPPISVFDRALSMNKPSVPPPEHVRVPVRNLQTTLPTPTTTGYYNQLINVKDLPTGRQVTLKLPASGFNGQVLTTTPLPVEETFLSSVTKAQEQLSRNRLIPMNGTTKGHLWMLGRTTDGPLHKKIRILNRIAELAILAERIYMTSTSAVPINNSTRHLREWRAAIAPFCNYTARQYRCNPKDKYRTADGSCNNLENPGWGSALWKQKRYLPAAYMDERSLPREFGVNGSRLPSARNLSTTLHSCGACNERSNILTVMMAAFGQILKNDLINTPVIKGDNNVPVDCCMPENINNSACFSIEIPDNDEHFINKSCMSYIRSASFPLKHCDPGVREQINQITSFLDASFIYGYTKGHQMNLRTLRNGLMKTGRGNLLPSTTDSHCIISSGKHQCFKSGDPRSQENPMLTVLHLLFIREHNRIANTLASLNRHWNDNRIFEEARKIVIAGLQHITYSEYLPILIGRYNMGAYRLQPRRGGHDTVYNATVNATITNAFGAAAFQFVSSEMPDYMKMVNSNFKVVSRQPLETQFYKSDLLFLTEGDRSLTRSMVSEAKQLLDRKLQNSVRNSLYMDAMGNSFDLAALIIQRGRDHGIPSYNNWRRWCGLNPAVNFGGGKGGLENHDAESRLLLSSVYSHPDDIDLYTGGISEKKSNGAIVGPVFACIIGNQFRELKVGDRFWYENKFQQTGFSKAQIKQIKRINLAYIVCKNMDLKKIQPSVFYLPIRRNFRRHCETLKKMSLRPWKARPPGHRRV